MPCLRCSKCKLILIRIPDPEASKPADWDEDAPHQIPDPDEKKPLGWLDNEPETISDPKASKPVDWDDEEDGDWVAPTIGILNKKSQILILRRKP